MEPDFLRRTLPYFYDKEGEELHDIGVVQAPWGYYNMHQNLLAEAGKLLRSLCFVSQFFANMPW